MKSTRSMFYTSDKHHVLTKEINNGLRTGETIKSISMVMDNSRTITAAVIYEKNVETKVTNTSDNTKNIKSCCGCINTAYGKNPNCECLCHVTRLDVNESLPPLTSEELKEISKNIGINFNHKPGCPCPLCAINPR